MALWNCTSTLAPTASFLIYEDDGKSFDYRKGSGWGLKGNSGASQNATPELRLARGSKMPAPKKRRDRGPCRRPEHRVVFEGRKLTVQL